MVLWSVIKVASSQKSRRHRSKRRLKSELPELIDRKEVVFTFKKGVSFKKATNYSVDHMKKPINVVVS